MKIEKLFKVLVVSGSMITAGSACDTGPEPVTANDAGSIIMADGAALMDAAQVADATTMPPDTDAANMMTPSDAGSEGGDAGLMECFCPSEDCCETDETGASVVRDGFICCWSSSC